MQNNRWLQALIVLLVIIASLFLAGQIWSFLSQFSSVIQMFFLAWLLAFILRPMARWLTSKGVPYTLSVLAVYLLLALVVAVAGILLIPVITDQSSQLLANFNSYVNDITALLDQGQRLLNSWGVKEIDLSQFYNQIASQVQSVGMGILQNAISVLQGIATFAFQFVLILLLSFYFMKDSEKLFGGILSALPPRWQDEARLLGMSIKRVSARFSEVS